MTYGFNDNNEKIPVNPKADTYTKTESFVPQYQNRGASRSVFFGGQIEIWTWREQEFLAIPANGNKTFTIYPQAELFEGITNPNEECSVFISIRKDVPVKNMTVQTGDFGTNSEEEWNHFSFAIINNENIELDATVDILIIKQPLTASN